MRRLRAICAGTALCVLVAGKTFAADPVPQPFTEFAVTGFTVSGENPLGEAETERLLSEFIGTYSTLAALRAPVDALQAVLNQRGYAFQRVVLPPQVLSSGSVRLEIVPITVSQVTVSGNEYFSEKNILRSLPVVRPGEVPARGALSGALELANLHAAKQVKVRLKESEASNAVDAVIDVEDERPWRLFTALNNIGTRDTGRTRLIAGGQYLNLFGLDHELTASYTTSPENTDDVMQAGASYKLPLYQARGWLSAFFSESDVGAGDVAGFDVSGAGRFWGVSFTRVLERRGGYSHNWTLGLQDRYFESDINYSVGGVTVPFGQNVRSHPVTLGYRGKFESDRWVGEMGASYSRNLKVGDGNNALAYSASRFGADPDWDAVRFDGEAIYYLPRDWLLRGEFEGQWSDDALIPGEEFGLGGERSIRGMNERAVIGDSGYRVTAEVWSPPIPKTLGLRVLAFVDFGMLDRHKVQPGEVNTDTVSSAGMGLRWQWRKNLSVRLDYGHTLAEGEGATAEAPDEAGVKWHFNVLASF